MLSKRLTVLALDDSLPLDLRAALIHAAGRNSAQDLESAMLIRRLLNGTYPDELRTAAAGSISALSGSTEAELVSDSIKAVLQSEQSPAVLGSLLGVLVREGDEDSLTSVRAHLFPGQDPRVLRCVAKAADGGFFTTKTQLLNLQTLAIDVFSVASDSETQIASVDSLIRLIPRTIYSGGSDDVVEVVVGRTYTLDEVTLQNASRAVALVNKTAAPETRAYVSATALPELEERLPFLRKNNTYQRLKASLLRK
jgi:hypothetical protein